MSVSSNNKGRAYEHAWITALHEVISSSRNAAILDNSSFKANSRAWDFVSENDRNTFAVSANAAVDTLIEMEPCMLCGDDELLLRFQTDKAGESGDVRDIVITRDCIGWEIGLSIKHNHAAVKHCRLSKTLDFGNEWYGIPCSAQYWSDIEPVFDILAYEKSQRKRWSELQSKNDDVYVPILKAFMDEIKRAYEQDQGIAARMFEYLIGVKDYHKIVSNDKARVTLIHTFNIHGTLNKQSDAAVSAIDVPICETPSEIIAIRHKKNSKTTAEIYMDNGWAFSFRIHSASEVVETSLKFDVQFISTPPSVLNISCKWHN